MPLYPYIIEEKTNEYSQNNIAGSNKSLSRSWQSNASEDRKNCKGYEIIEWNEDDFDISACSPLYVPQVCL